MSWLKSKQIKLQWMCVEFICPQQALCSQYLQVEAQEPGIMVKIFSDDGAKGVQVGTRIAVLGDEGDSVDALEIPADDSQAMKSPADNVAKAETSAPSYSSGTENAPKGTPENPRPSRDRPKSSPTNASAGPGQNPKYPMYPSVTALIHENHIPDSDVAKISATGPQNRLLKGDVLAYLGEIDADYSRQQSERIEHASHMDLSNIKILPASPPPSAQTTDPIPPAAPQNTSISLPISLTPVLTLQSRIHETLAITLPLSTFLARAVDFANEDLPSAPTPPTADSLFDAVLGLDTLPRGSVRVSRGQYLPSIVPAPSGTSRASPIRKPAQPDIIDVLSGRAGPLKSSNNPIAAGGKTIAAGGHAGAVNVFSLTVPIGEEKRARLFLERMKTVLQVEPGKLVL
jgi:hypothetical protein